MAESRWVTHQGKHIYIGDDVIGSYDTDKQDNPATNPLHPDKMSKDEKARYGDCEKMAKEWVSKNGGDVYSAGSHAIAVKEGKVYDYVLGIENMSTEEYNKKVPYQFIKLKALPEMKAVIEDILAKYLNYIDADNLKDFVFDIVKSNYQKGLDAGEIQFNRNFLPNYETLSFVQKFAFSNVKGLTEELKEQLRKEMSIGLMNREGIAQLKLRIMDVVDTSIARAEMITRTETNRAFNMGHFQSAKDSGLNVYKQWSAQNERVSKNGNFVPCPQCEAMDSVSIGMNERFSFSDGQELLLPPKHPHCACRVLYIQKK